jgi:CRP/FNR family transcriptional regulator
MLLHDDARATEAPTAGMLRDHLASRPGRRRLAGQHLYFIGEPAKSLFYVKSGLVRTSRPSPGGDQIILRICRSGEILGELCFSHHQRREDAVVLESSDIVEVPMTDFVAQLRRSPDAALELVITLSEQLEGLRDRMQSLAFESTMERLGRTLLMLAETLGEETSDGTHIVHYVRQEELAQMVAARREVVSGLLNRLRKSGLISYPRKGQISVHQRALRAFVDALAAKRAK